LASDRAIIIDFGNEISLKIHRQVYFLYCDLIKNPIDGVVNIHPAYSSIMLSLDRDTDPMQLMYEIEKKAGFASTIEKKDSNLIEIPVLYGDDHGPDIDRVAMINNIDKAEIIDLHTSVQYLVYFIGFSIGFPYLGELNDRLCTPRLENPRISVPKGSIGIGGNQTGIYPFSTPGGWNLIGNTPIELFNKECPQDSLIQIGNELRFIAIDEKEFERLSL
tara:strand:+ start:577 stop:1233 length:657 start_codon:yes stop_codon:yes gene_type:complete